nr:hypothetical protein [Tanacetum cinerariifolium]
MEKSSLAQQRKRRMMVAMTAKELYNKKHSSARNVIERCFEMTQDPLDNEVAVDHTQDGNEHDDVISTVEILNE